MKLSAATWRYLSDPASGLKTRASRYTYEKLLGQLTDALGDPDLGDLDPDALVDWVFRPGLSSSSHRLRRTVVTGLYRWAGFRDLLEGPDPSRKLAGVRAPRRPVREGHWLSATEARRIVEVCGDGTTGGLRDRVVVLLGLTCGLRRSEIAGLSWSDYNRSSRTLRVLGKGEKLAVVGVNDQLAEALDDLAVARGERGDGPIVPRLRYTAIPGGGADVHIEWDNRISATGVHSIVTRRGKQAGLPEVRPHDLRRTYAGLLKRSGMPLEDVSELLRHSNVGTTQIYLASDPTAAVERAQGFTL